MPHMLSHVFSGACPAAAAPRQATVLADASRALVGLAAAAALALGAGPAGAANNVRLPPLDTTPDRCERAYQGNTIGQANAVS